MIAFDEIATALQEWPQPRQEGDKILVPTQCLYPSNGMVVLTVEGGTDAFRVHDGGRTLDEAVTSVSSAYVSLASARHIARAQGLFVTDNWVIQSPIVRLPQLAGAMALVANVAKEIAHNMIDRAHPRPLRDMKEALAEILDKTFLHHWVQNEKIAGRSNKQHRFDFSVRLAGEKKLLIDAAHPDAVSINSVFVANLDVRNAGVPNIEQRIIYDDDVSWKSSDLALLSTAAKVIPFSRSKQIFSQMAA